MTAPEAGIGSPFLVEHHPVLPSTNDRALEWARHGLRTGERPRVAVVAERQTAGRGRRGHRWSSPPGGLYVSYLTWPRLDETQTPALPLLCGVALIDAVGPRVAVPLALKWPNDLLVGGDGPLAGRKLSGVLVERLFQGPDRDPVVFGIGLNLVRREHGQVDHGRAVSLAELGVAPGPNEGSDPFSGAVWVDRIGHALSVRLERAGTEGSRAWAEDYERALFGRGENVRWEGPDGSMIDGKLVGVVQGGGLLLETPAGQRVLDTGTVAFPECAN
ncbi:MAG TPA: biotin--[acetyl-CoA-carboxylase] ligase [Myxococcales bacterium LLY-WYZ-16_1]|nr:biotin--[acetyl-CoA-carboxylase] ligase [Myxococcales bacterium LLY-WYZ-16_1]